DGVGAGQIGFQNGNVTYGGATIGTAPTAGPGSGKSGAGLVVTLNGNATIAATKALIERLTYQNTSTHYRALHHCHAAGRGGWLCHSRTHHDQRELRPLRGQDSRPRCGLVRPRRSGKLHFFLRRSPNFGGWPDGRLLSLQSVGRDAR